MNLILHGIKLKLKVCSLQCPLFPVLWECITKTLHSGPVYQGRHYFVSNDENICKSGLVHLKCPHVRCDLKTQINFTNSTFRPSISCFTTTDKGVWLIHAGSFIETRRAGTFVDIYEE